MRVLPARVVTSAAVIIVEFLAFVADPNVIVQMFGLGRAVGSFSCRWEP